MFHHQKNPIRRLHVAAQTKKNELLYLTKSRYKFLMVHVCSFRISWHSFIIKIQTHKDWPVSGYLVITNKKKRSTELCFV